MGCDALSEENSLYRIIDLVIQKELKIRQVVFNFGSDLKTRVKERLC